MAGVRVGVTAEPDPWLDEVATRCARVAGDVQGALRLGRELGQDCALPGVDTAARWSCLASLGACDLTVARAVEPHLDALAILAEAQAGEETVPADAVLGVWAAEGPGTRVVARPLPSGGAPGRWALGGTKPWCSLADDVTHALVTAWIDEERRGLFAVALDQPGIQTADEPWVPHGLRRIRSTSVRFAEAEAVPVGGPGWYLERDGFAWGGIGVAAVWYGGAVGLVRRLTDAAAKREPDQIGLAHLGATDAALYAAASALSRAARLVDAGEARGDAGAVLALRVRQVVADSAERVLRSVDHALGPGPLVSEPEHVARVSDLRVYLRQHHAERDAAALGRHLVHGGSR
ncbi:hypothetical protein CLV56_0350 [Mumia flava]|uniref:Alkylation response protein AidB-like acyl-CoA dehydrogenase n=1 Tax=Mumia flava TaxID=1348852 RepID=A0A2M9BDX9_9ACTN|nr:acyl-CoA dehydrogenase [Mumia flava]PJJ56146.1 hypothetical protein CLV56_0350 [Mumia flava]